MPAEPIRVVVLEGDQTGQELLEAVAARSSTPTCSASSVRARCASTSRWRTGARPTTRSATEAAAAMEDAGPRPEGGDDHARGQADDVGSPNRPDPRGHRRHGDRPHRPPDPRRHPHRRHPSPDLRLPDGRRRRLRRRAVARGPDGDDELALRTETDQPVGSAARSPSTRSARRSRLEGRSTAARSGPSARSTRGC